MMEVCGVVPLAIAAYTDFRRREICPQSLFLLASVAILNVVFNRIPWHQAIGGFLLIGIPFFLCALCFGAGNGIGGGDVKLCALMGLLLGLVRGYMVITVALVALMTDGHRRRVASLPFAPYLLASYIFFLLAQMIWR